eukprot:TRINITY_DN36025_c0_g1_i1.p2 TRINITY_DN36025_c0_g1~~TRINITY_DN36025_c0_g1_i1.p2  ORF type:complete len:113 (-),score=29.55 TRINITY_DN36025_c0_g1_i1:49-387(-)
MGEQSTTVINSQEFERLLNDQRTGKDKGLMVADFFADWCQPCKVVAPKVEALARRYPAVKFVKIDISEPNPHREAQNVSGVPTFKIYKSGEPKFVWAGTDLARVENAIKANL